MSARPTANPTGLKAVGTNLIVNYKTTLNSLSLIPDGTNACSVIAFDSLVGSGKQIAQVNCPATSLIPVTVDFSNAIKCEIGLTLVVAGGTANAMATHGGA